MYYTDLRHKINIELANISWDLARCDNLLRLNTIMSMHVVKLERLRDEVKELLTSIQMKGE